MDEGGAARRAFCMKYSPDVLPPMLNNYAVFRVEGRYNAVCDAPDTPSSVCRLQAGSMAFKS